MSKLFSIFDPKGEVFEVPAHKLPLLKKAGWSTSPSTVSDLKPKASRKSHISEKPKVETQVDESQAD